MIGSHQKDAQGLLPLDPSIMHYGSSDTLHVVCVQNENTQPHTYTSSRLRRFLVCTHRPRLYNCDWELDQKLTGQVDLDFVEVDVL